MAISGGGLATSARILRATRLVEDLLDVSRVSRGLPDIDGHELVRLIRQEPQTADAVRIAVTGYGHERNRKTAIEAGFQHYLVKPVDTAKLVDLLAGVAHSKASCCLRIWFKR